jgi:foldase protein PrsA
VKRAWIPILLIVLIPLSACKSRSTESADETGEVPSPPVPIKIEPMDNPVVATIRGEPITVKDLEPVLIDGYGLNVLLEIVQLDLAREECAKLHIVVTPQDIDREKEITLRDLKRSVQATEPYTTTTQPSVDDDISPQEAQQLLDQILAQQHITQPEFDIWMEINANLRKIAEPQVSSQITDDAVRQQFNVMYGEKVVVHYIVCWNMNEAADVRRDLAAGKSFEEVARARSHDRESAPSGGELPPFTLQDGRFPPEFKQLAFTMKKGDISDPLEIGQFIYIMKLVDRIPPQHAKFEDYKDAVKKDLYEQAVEAEMTAMRQQLAKMALDSMTIQDPTLAKQWETRVASKNGQLHDMQAIRQRMDQEHAAATQASGPSATQPAASPAPASRP